MIYVLIELALSEIRRETLEEAARICETDRAALVGWAGPFEEDYQARARLIRALAQPKKGATDEQDAELRHKIDDGLARPETATELREATEQARAAIARLESALRVDPHSLHDPMTI